VEFFGCRDLELWGLEVLGFYFERVEEVEWHFFTGWQTSSSAAP